MERKVEVAESMTTTDQYKDNVYDFLNKNLKGNIYFLKVLQILIDRIHTAFDNTSVFLQY